MEQEDRKKKLAAGKEKLEAFRKKRAKKKKAEGEKAQVPTSPQAQTLSDLSQDGSNGIDDRDLANLAVVSDISSAGDSDNYSSLTSGDEWSGEDSELYAAVHYQKKYVAAAERIAALEEAVQGKQLALDSLVQEMQSSNLSSPKVDDGRVSEADLSSSLKGSMPELQEALVQRDKIIRQLTARLQETAALKSNGVGTEDPDYMQETCRLSQQVVMLQQQLAQAGETVQQQVSMCQMSVRALQEAKEQIMSLQSRVMEKNNHLQHISLTLDLRSSEVDALKRREAELVQVVDVFQRKELRDESSEIDTALSATRRVNSLEKELEKLTSEHTQSLKTMDELQQRLNLSETSRQALINEKEEALEKIVALEEELDQLGQVRDAALQKMFQLECQVHDGSALLQAEDEGRYKANERITELERALAELNAEHSAVVAQITQSQTSPQTASSPESRETVPDELSDLKNVINSQQGELLLLRQQLKSTEDELTASREKVALLQGQLDELQSQQNADHRDASHAIQQDLDALRTENTHYQQQTALIEEQVQSFKESLKNISLSDPDITDKDTAVESPFSLSALESETDVTKQIQLLHTSYTHLISQYTEMRKQNQQLATEVETSTESVRHMQDLAAVVSSLQEEVEQWKAVVKKKDSEIEKITDQLKEVLKEKDQIASHVQLQEETVEQRTLQSDTMHRKMESRVNSLFSELTECKEALRESEVANMELQEKLDKKSSEADALKFQLAASEDLMKELQSKANTHDDLQKRTQEAQAELQDALEEIKTLSQVHAHLEDKDLQLQAVQKEKESAEEEAKIKHCKLEEDLRSRQLQMEQILEEHKLALSEKDQKVSFHQEEIQHLEENLQQKTSELESMLSLKEAVVQEKHSEVQEMCNELDKKSHELHAIVAEKERLLSDREGEIQQIQVQLEEKTKEVEKLISDLALVKADKETEMSVLLSEKTKEAEQVIAEKDHLISTLSSSEAEKNQELQNLQQKLDHQIREHEILLVENGDLESQLSEQQLASSKELKELHENLQQKVQECEILWMESEQRWEDLQSHSSIRSKEFQNLKQEQEQQTQKYEILLSDWERLEADLHSCQSALQKSQQKLKQTETELNNFKGGLSATREAATSKEHSMKELQSEVKQLREQLNLAQITGDEASQERQRALQAVQSHADALEQELDTQKEELASLQSKLAAQADMFKVKEEEMVAENNALNHQLEEVRNAAQETVDQLKRDGDNLCTELESVKTSLRTREIELTDLREENIKERDRLNTSLAAVTKERDQLAAKILHLEDSLKEVSRECDSRVDSLQRELNRLCEERNQELPKLEKEILHLNEQNTVLQDQLDSCALNIDQLQRSLKDSDTEQEKLKIDRDRLLQQQDTMQVEFASQLEHAQSQVAAKDSELQALEIQRNEARAELEKGLESLQEELSTVQSELAQKESALMSITEELATATSQLGHLTEEKEMLKNNFDCCMEEMTQRANERDDSIRLLQGQLTEASQNMDQCQDKLREQYESQLTEYEDRLAKADLELQRLEKVVENTSAEKEKLKETFSGQIADFELAIQTAESESSSLKEQMSKMADSHEKEIADLKQSHEIQLASVEENCQSLEKALARQDALMCDVSSKFERDGSERDNAYEQHLSDAFEQVRLHEMDVSRLRRQMDEMRKDHQKEQAELQKSLEVQIFDLENKCTIATSETDRLRQSLWGMEQDYAGEVQSLQYKIQELEALSHSQEKQISDLQDKLMHSSQNLDDSVLSLKESYQAEIHHLDELNHSLNGDIENLKEQLKTTEETHSTEMEALKHQYTQDANVIQERCRQTENYSKVLQSHIDSASESTPDVWILRAETERLQHELAASEAAVSQLQRKLKGTQTLSESKILDLTGQVQALIEDKTSKDTLIENLTEDLENEKHMLQESQMFCQDLEEKNMHLDSENKSLRSHAPQACTTDETEGRFVSTEEANRVAELKQMINQLTQELQRIQASGAESRNADPEENADVEGGFEPEPDSLEYLDLAVGPNPNEDYFVEENEHTKSDAESPVKLRTRSVPSEMFVAADDYLQPPLLSLGPICEVQQPPRPDLVMDGFQPESPISQHPTNVAPNHSFLPVDLFHEQAEDKNKAVMRSDSFTQTDFMDTSSPFWGSPEIPLNVSQNAMVLEDDRKQGDEVDFARRLKSLQEQLEEEWVLKMRAQEVELRHSLELEYKELQRQIEHQCQQQIQSIKQETQASFVDAIRKMRKGLEKKNEQKQQIKALKEKLTTKSKKDTTQMPKDATDGEELGEKLRQLHEENQELAEVRDVLLKQIDISQTQSRRYTMQHELQAVISGKFSPSESLKSVSGGDAVQAEYGVEHIPASESKLCAATAIPGNDNDEEPVGPLTVTVGSDDDGDDDRSDDGSCARDRFLEELEEMSQQSGQDLPLEWELTSTNVSHASTSGGTDVFERDPAGSGSVWEVFDGRCLRQDCREVRHRYNNLFRWFSRVCSLLSKPGPQLGESGVAGQGVGVGLEQARREGGEEVGEGGWVEAGAEEELDSVVLSQIHQGNDVSVEAILSEAVKGCKGWLGLDDVEPTQLSEAELLHQLLSLETQNISLEQCMSSQQQLFNQECEELKLTRDSLKSKCDELKSSNDLLVKQIAVLEEKCMVLQGDSADKSTLTDMLSYPQAKKTEESLENSKTLQETCDSLQQQLQSVQSDKEGLEYELVAVKKTSQTLQEVLREKEELLTQQIQTLIAQNEATQEDLTVLQKTKEELSQEVKAMANYQELVQERDAVQDKCIFLEEQLTAAQEDVSKLRHDNQSCLSAVEEELSKFRSQNETLIMEETELKEKASHLENQCCLLRDQLGAAQEDVTRLHHEKQSLLEEKVLLSAQETELKEKEKTLLELRNKYSSLENQFSVVQENASVLHHEHENILQERNELCQHLEILQDGNTLQGKGSSLKEQVVTVTELVVKLHQENEKLLEEKQLLESKYQEESSSLEELESKCRALEIKLTAAHELVSSLHHENESILEEKQAHDAEDKEKGECLVELKKKCSDLEDHLAGAHELESKLRLEIKHLLEEEQGQCAKLQAGNVEIEDLKNKCHNLEDQLAAALEQVSRLRHETDGLLEEKQGLLAKTKEESERLQEVKNKCIYLEDQVDKANEVFSKGQREKEQLLEKELELDVKHRDEIQHHKEFKVKYCGLEGQFADAKKLLSKLRQENEDLLKDVQSKSRELEETRERIEDSEHQFSFLNDQVISAEKVISGLRSENQLLTEQNLIVSSREEIHKEKETLQTRCSSLSQQVKDAHADVAKLRLENQLLEEKLAFTKNTGLEEVNENVADLEIRCGFLEEQLTAAHNINSKLLNEHEERHAQLAKYKELKEKCEHLKDVEARCKVWEDKCKALQEENALLLSDRNCWRTKFLEETNYSSCQEAKSLKNLNSESVEHRSLQNKVLSLQDECKSLQEKMEILEESNKSLKDQCVAIQDRNQLLEVKLKDQSSNNDVEFLQAELQFVKENLQVASEMNNSLRNKVHVLETSKQLDGNLQEKNKALHEKCAVLLSEKNLQAVELKQMDRALKQSEEDCKLLEEKYQVLQEELLESTQSGSSLRMQLHEQSATLKQVISEMRAESSHNTSPDHAFVNAGLEVQEEVSSKEEELKKAETGSPGKVPVEECEQVESMQHRVEGLEQFLSEKEGLIAELKEQLTLLSLQQAAVGAPCAQRESTTDLEKNIQELREEIIEKENAMQELQKKNQSMKQTLAELRRKVKDDSDLEQEVNILQQALFEKDMVIQDLKETSKTIQFSHLEKSQIARNTSTSNTGQPHVTDQQEKILTEESERSQLRSQDRSARAKSVASTESLAVSVSSDPDSDIGPGQDFDIVKEMGRLRKDIKKTKAVYANESALFQEALDREPVSQLGLRSSRSPSSTCDFFEMTPNDIPDDPEQLKKMVIRLLDENKSLTTENLRLQLRIREQEALVVDLEERISHDRKPPEDWQSLFERQVLLLQKQRDELLHQVFERDSGLKLLSSRMGSEAVGALAVHQRQDDLTVKIGELEHCHRLLQQRQAELAHCQAEKRHLEQLLLLKDETERQLMRQKRLLEEDLATIEGKLQEREATLVEEKARLMRELKEKERHIFHLQTSQAGHPRDPATYHLHGSSQMGRPQSSSTPRLGVRLQSTGINSDGGKSVSSEAFFLHHPSGSHARDLSPCLKPSEEGAQGGSFLQEENSDPVSRQRHPSHPESHSLPDQDAKPKTSPDEWLANRRHSTGTAKPGRFLPAPMPKDPEEIYNFHRDAVERLRDKLQLEVESEMARLSESQAAAISEYWERHNKQVP